MRLDDFNVSSIKTANTSTYQETSARGTHRDVTGKVYVAFPRGVLWSAVLQRVHRDGLSLSLESVELRWRNRPLHLDRQLTVST